jgi:hypothetical protein
MGGGRGGAEEAWGEEGGVSASGGLAVVPCRAPARRTDTPDRLPSPREATNRFQLSVERQLSPRRTELDPIRTLSHPLTTASPPSYHYYSRIEQPLVRGTPRSKTMLQGRGLAVASGGGRGAERSVCFWVARRSVVR